ncbi:cobalt ECF transporter T component CbiQ [Clostridium chromiireducens]|uniref:cobalt ECF transporter T component CbiQ n=1 Tax=Clostridium chromiireducens TaxID=225345 RepID=UPI003AF96E5B
MESINNSIYNLRFLDETAYKKSLVHSINPVAKLFVTLLYSMIVISFDKYDISGVVPFVFYPIIIFVLSGVPYSPVLKRMFVAMPFVLGVGILNPIFDTRIHIEILGIGIFGGWISFVSLIIKSSLTILAGLLLISTTKAHEIAWALRKIGVPKIFVIQFLLTYRYIFILSEEVLKIIKAYNLRSPFKNTVTLKVSGSLLGQMLMRSIDRADRVYNAMILRGFDGEYFYNHKNKLLIASLTYFFLWTIFIITLRFVNISELLGNLLMGVLR